MISAGVFPISGGFVTATLLAVDDSKTMRKVIENTFAGENYRVVLADSPADAMAKLRAEKPSVALVDALLGGTSGYDLCQQMKAEAPQVGIIVLSSKQHPYDRVKGGAVAADDFLDKPYDSQALIDKVAALVQKIATAPVARQPERAVERPAAAPVVRPAPVTVTTGAPHQPGVAPGPAPQAGTVPRSHTATMSFGVPVATRPTPPAQPTAVAHAPAQTPVGTPTAVRPAVFAAPAVAAAPLAVQPAPVQPAAAGPAVSAMVDASMETKLTALGLTKDQIAGVVALSREVVEQVVWEVVPVLAETMIREEIKRLTAE
jgi:CheY-like chemotaxis protein